MLSLLYNNTDILNNMLQNLQKRKVDILSRGIVNRTVLSTNGPIVSNSSRVNSVPRESLQSLPLRTQSNQSQLNRTPENKNLFRQFQSPYKLEPKSEDVDLYDLNLLLQKRKESKVEFVYVNRMYIGSAKFNENNTKVMVMISIVKNRILFALPKHGKFPSNHNELQLFDESIDFSDVKSIS